MKRNIATMMILSMMICSAQSDLIKYNFLCERYNTTFYALGEKEVLTYIDEVNKENNLEVFVENKVTKGKKSFASIKGSWGASQISADQRKMILFLPYIEEYEGYCPLFLLDGNTGTMTYIMSTFGDVRTDKSMRYLLYRAFDGNNTLYVLYDLTNKRVVRTIHWTLKRDPNDIGGFVAFRRSLDPKYDFRIDIGVDWKIAAQSYYNIAENKLITVFDKTDADSGYYLDREEPTLEELGKL